MFNFDLEDEKQAKIMQKRYAIIKKYYESRLGINKINQFIEYLSNAKTKIHNKIKKYKNERT